MNRREPDAISRWGPPGDNPSVKQWSNGATDPDVIAHVLRPTSGGPARALGVDDCPKDVSFKGFKILLLAIVGVKSLRGRGCTAPFGGDSVRLLSVWRAGPGCSVSLSLLLCHVVRGDAVKTRGCRWRVYVKLEKFRILYDSPGDLSSRCRSFQERGNDQICLGTRWHLGLCPRVLRC